ncbi:MAG: adenosine deaminase [Maricaulis sp.]|uniref:adenosine deaminase n=1 Tax=Maricaulis sp. TaxID=1486257 RepID=UPI001B005020|nr:adenosine deaminase [Maricaulis sp.]MBO6728937.1 adenosine deaminase [Maricaulis sp.]MBO6847859.1 adenosine deaminase [Maricaulis sp.]MBO6877482.1 adenosine deaminase [Maricaulis sp.]
MSALNDLIARLPKAELHLHIEGSLEPELMMALAQRNGIELPYKTVEEIRAAYEFSNLQDFLDIYYVGMNVLQTEQDFFDLAWAYLERAHADNVRHVEIFFDPQGHTERGIAFATVIDGLTRALEQAEDRCGLTSQLIMCFLRHLSEVAAFETLEQAMGHLERIDGVGLDSSEMGHPPSKFERVFARAGELGLKRVAHAGEEGPPEYIYEALDLLQIDRVDHGNRALEDTELVQRLVDSKMALTVCPLSNLRLCGVERLEDHPLKRMLELGLLATCNSDDPAYFGGYVNDNFRRTAEAVGLTAGEIITLARNSFIGSFLPQDAIARHLAEIDAVIASELA